MYKFQPLKSDDVPTIIDMINARIHWMDEKGYDSWNHDDYLSCYPTSYFIEQAHDGRLWGLVDERGRIISVGTLLREDSRRWTNDVDAIYIHNLVAVLDVPGAGTAFLNAAEAYALSIGIDRIRLDANIRNEPLNAYYERHGYELVGKCDDGDYHGYLREKLLK